MASHRRSPSPEPGQRTAAALNGMVDTVRLAADRSGLPEDLLRDVSTWVNRVKERIHQRFVGEHARPQDGEARGTAMSLSDAAEMVHWALLPEPACLPQAAVLAEKDFLVLLLHPGSPDTAFRSIHDGHEDDEDREMDELRYNIVLAVLHLVEQLCARVDHQQQVFVAHWARAVLMRSYETSIGTGTDDSDPIVELQQTLHNVREIRAAVHQHATLLALPGARAVARTASHGFNDMLRPVVHLSQLGTHGEAENLPPNVLSLHTPRYPIHGATAFSASSAPAHAADSLLPPIDLDAPGPAHVSGWSTTPSSGRASPEGSPTRPAGHSSNPHVPGSRRPSYSNRSRSHSRATRSGHAGRRGASPSPRGSPMQVDDDLPWDDLMHFSPE